MTKNSVCHAPYLRNHTPYDCHLCYTNVEWQHLLLISSLFFKILHFLVIRRVKGQKMTQNDKKLCPSGLISQEPYTIWSSFMVHMCKRIIPVGVFKIFPNSNFQEQQWGKMAKNGQKRQKIMSLALHTQEADLIWLWFLVHMCNMMIISSNFFHFFKILIFLFLNGTRGEKGKKWPVMSKFSLSHSISWEL